jgi:uncharacterized protein
MNLKERLMADMYDAMRNKDVPRREAIRMIRAAIKNAEIAWQRDASDEDILTLISQEIKRRVEALEMFRKGGRADLVAEEEAGLAVLRPYLPQQMSRAEIMEAVQHIIAAQGATKLEQVGSVMRQAMADLKGKADGRLVNEVAREMLSK